MADAPERALSERIREVHPASITDVDALADEVAALEQRAAAAEYNFGVEHDENHRLREAIEQVLAAYDEAGLSDIGAAVTLRRALTEGEK